MATFISPEEAQRLVKEKDALLIDVRETSEFANVRIAGSRLQPLSVLPLLPEDTDKERPAIYFCGSGRRTAQAQGKLELRGHAENYILNGGIQAWQSAGLPVESAGGAPDIMRQVRLVAGCLVIAFTLLSGVSPVFSILTVLVGAGLAYSGLSGKCGMALLLQRMPWNKQS